MDLSSPQVIVTGALGWLGRRLVEVIANGLADHEALRTPRPDVTIRALILPGQDGEELKRIAGRVVPFVGDIRNPADCERLCEGSRGALLFHTAGVIHPRRVREFYDVNLLGTENLLAAATRCGVRRAVVVSSNSPFGFNASPEGVFDETSPFHPVGHYGRSKMKMELAVRARQQRGDLEAVIVRAPWFYGTHQPLRQTLFFAMVRDGKAPIVGGGGNRRSMAYLDNLCQGLLLAGATPAANGKAYWIADRRAYTMNEITGTIERLLETEFGQRCVHRRLRLPGLASAVAGAIDAALQSVGLYNQKLHVLSEMNKTIACSIALAERELGYCPAVELEEGMRRSLRWCADQRILF